MSEPIHLNMPTLKEVCADLGMPGAVANFPPHFQWPLPALAREARRLHPKILSGETLTFSIYGRTLVVDKQNAYFEED